MDEEKLIVLLTPLLGARARAALDALVLPDAGGEAEPDSICGAELAFALAAALHQGLLDRAPTGAAYVADRIAAGGRVLLDHGALRTIRLPDGERTGAMPAGADAFARLLEPLGYRMAGVYPLDRLRMTGYAWCHAEHPHALPQYFVSELHVDRFGPDFQAAARRIFGTTADPLNSFAREALARLAAQGRLALEDAAELLPVLARAFDRHHDAPALADYEALKRESAEAAWIATEGNAFNHGTDRVADLDATVAAQRAAGRAMKDVIEISGSGRVRQTATRADRVERPFLDKNGRHVTMGVPGSFYEFISRDMDPETGAPDLRFDSGNAQGIFKMTTPD
ncbi:DUF1338 domain-containing protein [Sphingobium jiangsuense]|uniref:2-oxoadipate dioxygenase/decarboxylase n=1 Tax=Sphingobium jiangsuense TaxID=870476 RepID=A0A7W6BJ16_9SPHN|nr:DUF1338 family protein [Sphingobium jiangsuense]MBB3924442.1 hypothetical protein [Sphingobium jiangsuense]GLT02268.1 DUF1338 domain-containing protein [Sphingobium jiangsuense]